MTTALNCLPKLATAQGGLFQVGYAGRLAAGAVGSEDLAHEKARMIELDLGRYASGHPVLNPLHSALGLVVPEQFARLGWPTQMLNELSVRLDLVYGVHNQH